MGLNVDIVLPKSKLTMSKKWILMSLLVFTTYFSFFSNAVLAEEIVNNPVVVINTSMGEIMIELYPKAAPKTVDNFLSYANSHYYDGLIFHRVIDKFMIQAGGYWYDHSPKEPTQESVVNESNNSLKNLKGSIAMARLPDPDSAKAQFFINLKNNPHLDANKDQLGYTVFGNVIAGQEVVETIGKVPVQYLSSRFANMPKTAVQILSIKLKETH